MTGQVTVSDAPKLLKVSVGDSAEVAKISFGDVVVWQNHEGVPYTVPFEAEFDGTPAPAPPPDPTLSVTAVTDISVSVVASGVPYEPLFGDVVGYNFYRNGVIRNVTADNDGVFTFTGLVEDTTYTLQFTYVNADNTESAKYGTTVVHTISNDEALSKKHRDNIDAIIKDHMKPTAGKKNDWMQVGVYTPEGEYFKGYGSDRTAPVTPNSVARYGSITKIYTALLALKQIELGHLHLDDTIDEWVGTLIPKSDQITIQHLLTMRSGIRDYLQEVPAVQLFYFLVPTAGIDPWAWFSHQPLLFEPGAGTRYSNSNYVILGYIVEQLDKKYGTSRDIRTIMYQELLQPYGLMETAWPTGVLPEGGGGPVARAYADNLLLPVLQAFLGPFTFLAALFGIPISAEIQFTALNTSYAGAAGALSGTIKDLVKFGKLLATGGMLSVPMDRLQKSQYGNYTTYIVNNPWEGPGVMEYGLGVLSWGQWFGWVGNAAGYCSALWVHPETGSAVAVLGGHMQGILDVITASYKTVYELYPDTIQKPRPRYVYPTDVIPSGGSLNRPRVLTPRPGGDDTGKQDVALEVSFYV